MLLDVHNYNLPKFENDILELLISNYRLRLIYFNYSGHQIYIEDENGFPAFIGTSKSNMFSFVVSSSYKSCLMKIVESLVNPNTRQNDCQGMCGYHSTFLIPSFKTPTELKMKLQLSGNHV